MKVAGAVASAAVILLVMVPALGPIHRSRRAKGPRRAVCVLHPVGSSGVSGMVLFTDGHESVQIEAKVAGLEPGKHGFHIHEFGDCSVDGTSAGGHFNPSGMPHGSPASDKRHVGDLGNLEANETGEAVLRCQDPLIRLTGKHSIIGRSIVVHAGPDDFVSQPTGNAGARIACGVIGIAKPLAE